MLEFPLLDKLPNELHGIVYDFWWDRDKLQTLDLPEETVSIGELVWQLDLPWWQYQGKPFQIKPRQVLDDPVTYQEQYKRALAVDLSYPIIIREEHDRKIIIDGVHRLLKVVIHDLPSVKAAVFSEEMIPLILHSPTD